MIKTYTFKEMNLVQKVDWLSDMLGESCFQVAFKPYQEMTETEQQRVKVIFFDYLNTNHIDNYLTSDVVEECEKQFPTSPLSQLLRKYGYYPVVKDSPIKEAAETLNNLKGEKVTIIKFSDFGFPIAWNTTLNKAESLPYAQYNESLQIIHKPKGKRSYFRNTILPGEDILIYKGWLNIDTEKLTYDIEQSENMTIQRSKYGCFDKNYMIDIMNNVKSDPIVKLIK
jgi:hypothetical protein